ncbi:hypothetical protein M595_4613 [Lyngbya aestuarii BL J]|uniref:Uncharacterized protein n=1 Tax=Lyngbya aestuarii BL J TaxID=1348334 RepID=U7QC99_9CYAN|nr:hypothetical protein M595_4613 [Lyngbya aestuarii BL J]
MGRDWGWILRSLSSVFPDLEGVVFGILRDVKLIIGSLYLLQKSDI